MSHWAGYSGIGLILSYEEVCGLLECYNKIHKTELDADCIPFDVSLQAGSIEPNPHVGDIGYAAELASVFEIDRIDSEYCEGILFIPYRTPNGAPNQTRSHYPGFQTTLYDTYVVFSDYSPSGVFGVEITPYHGYEEIKKEFRAKCRAYLPEDFDWDSHIGQISYAAYA